MVRVKSNRSLGGPQRRGAEWAEPRTMSRQPYFAPFRGPKGLHGPHNFLTFAQDGPRQYKGEIHLPHYRTFSSKLYPYAVDISLFNSHYKTRAQKKNWRSPCVFKSHSGGAQRSIIIELCLKYLLRQQLLDSRRSAFPISG